MNARKQMWSPEEIDLVMACYEFTPTAELAGMMGRSPQSVYYLASVLDLHKSPGLKREGTRQRRKHTPLSCSRNCNYPGASAAAPTAQPADSVDAAALPQPPVAFDREVKRCPHCRLVQFRTSTDTCRRCKKSLVLETQKTGIIEMAAAKVAVQHAAGEIQVGRVIRTFRLLRRLSQRQMAARMRVPRTYISKVENARAVPTLRSLDRLARALQVDVAAILQHCTRDIWEIETLLQKDAFLIEIARLLPLLDESQKARVVSQAHELSCSVPSAPRWAA